MTHDKMRFNDVSISIHRCHAKPNLSYHLQYTLDVATIPTPTPLTCLCHCDVVSSPLWATFRPFVRAFKRASIHLLAHKHDQL